MADNNEYYKLEIIGNKKTKTGDQISEWLPPKVEEMKAKMNAWNWSKPFEFEMPEKSLISDFDDLLKENGLPEKLPDIGKLILFNSSKLTDFIKGSFLDQYGLIVSNNVKKTFEKYNIGIHKYYPLTLNHKGVNHNNYYLFKPVTISIKNSIRKKIDLLKINNFGTIQIAVSSNLTPAISKLTGVKLIRQEN